MKSARASKAEGEVQRSTKYEVANGVAKMGAIFLSLSLAFFPFYFLFFIFLNLWLFLHG